MDKDLNKTYHSPSHDKNQNQVTAFMEALVYECSRVNQELKIHIPPEDDPSLSVRDSIMFGEISPHHDYYDRKSGTETPPSYNQLNYSDNLQRFFESKPSTATTEYIPEPGTSFDMDLKMLPLNQHEARKCRSPIQQNSEGSRGSGSFGESNARVTMPEGSAKTNSSAVEDTHLSDNSQYPHLTESILIKHNTEMEKILFKKYRDARSVSKAREREKIIERRERIKDFIMRYNAALMKRQCSASSISQEKQIPNNGIKRPSSQIWNTNEIKIAKYNATTRFDNGKSDILQNDHNIGSHNNAYHSVRNIGMQDCSFTLGIMPQMQIMENVNTPTKSLPTNDLGSPYVIYPSIGAQTYAYSPMNTMACHLWGFGCAPPTPSAKETGLYCLTQSNFRQVLQQNVTQEEYDTDTDIYYHSSSNGVNGLRKDSNNCLTSINNEENKQEADQLILINTSPKNKPTEDLRKNENKNCHTSSNTNEDEESSSFSYFYSSFCKTENGSYNEICESVNKNWQNAIETRKMSTDLTSASSYNEVNEIRNSATETSFKFDTKFEITKRQIPVRKLEPPWLDQVVYQVETKTIQEALEADMIALKGTSQPVTVDDQLSQLYKDLQLEGFPSRLTLEEGITSSSSSGETQNSSSKTPKTRKREYDQLMMLFELEAPLPSPLKDSDDEIIKDDQ